MVKAFGRAMAAALLIASVTVPATAQTYSDSYTFLKGVKERDGDKVASLIASPGTTVINARDRANGEGALHYLVRERDFAWLTFILGKGARPDIQNNEGFTPLALAAQIGWEEGAVALLARRASVDLANRNGETPLILAVHHRDLAMVRLLLVKGANPRRTDSLSGLSALDYAKRDAPQLVKMLEAPVAAPRPVSGPKL